MPDGNWELRTRSVGEISKRYGRLAAGYTIHYYRDSPGGLLQSPSLSSGMRHRSFPYFLSTRFERPRAWATSRAHCSQVVASSIYCILHMKAIDAGLSAALQTHKNGNVSKSITSHRLNLVC